MSTTLRLIAIERSGKPRESTTELPGIAREVLSATAQLYERAGFAEPWVGYLAFQGETCVGTCGFKGAPHPTEHGPAVEIAYFTFPEYEGRGIATRMAEALCDIASSEDKPPRILAQTLSERNASHRILEKLGFERIGTVDHPEDGQVAEWEFGPR